MNNVQGFFSDEPIDHRSSDLYGREDFAQRISIVVNRMGEQGGSSVSALVGAWGSGKSSTMNLLVQRLLIIDSGWSIHRFNPWLFSDINALVLNFFSTLTSAMPRGRRGKEARSKLADYGERLAPLGKLGKFFGLDAESIVKAAAKALSDTRTVDKRRADLTEELKGLDSKTLIVMDDIDRLQPDELLLVLKLIRLIGDLPNVHYLLAYDEKTMLDVLKGTPIGSDSDERAAQYMEKIVQIRFDLPPLTKRQAEAAFAQGCATVFDASGCALAEDEVRRLDIFYDVHMRRTLSTPRAINKYFAQLAVFFTRSVSEEVNVVDFFALTFIRTFHGTLYSRLAGWKEALAGPDDRLFLPRGEKERLEQGRREWNERLRDIGLSGLEERRAMELLGALFPSVGSLLEGVRIGAVSDGAVRRARHVASPDYFDRYFFFGVPGDDISDALVHSALSFLVDGGPANQAVTDLLMRLNSQPDLLLSKFRALIPVHPCSNPVALMEVLDSRYRSEIWLDRQGLLSTPQDTARYLAFDVVMQASESVRELICDWLIDSASLIYALDIARTLMSGDRSAGPWFSNFIDRLDHRSRRDFRSKYATLEGIERDDFDDLRSWAILMDDGVARAYAQERISAGDWGIDDYLVQITGTRVAIGRSNAPPRLSELETDWIQYMIGVAYAIEHLGVERLSTASHAELGVPWPTREQRLNLALWKLNRLRLGFGEGSVLG